MSDTDQDLQHLDLLATFHSVMALVVGLFSLIPLFHLAFGIAMITGHFGEANSRGTGDSVTGWILASAGAALILFGETMAFCLWLAGRSLRRRRRYRYCLAIACLSCLFMPLGTALGVFTIIVLSRLTVKQSFAGMAPDVA